VSRRDRGLGAASPAPVAAACLAVALPVLLAVAAGAPAGGVVVLVVLGVLAGALSLRSLAPRPFPDEAGPRPPPFDRERAAVHEALFRLDQRVGALARSRRAARPPAAGRFRAELVAAVRHELKTPLNAILGFSQVLLDELDGPLDPRQREDVEAIREAGRFVERLVEEVLDEWTGEHGAIPLAEIDLEVLLWEAAAMLRPRVGARPVEIAVVAAPGIPPFLGSARRLLQAVLNLGANALAATARGRIRLEVARAGPVLRVAVVDPGAGMDGDALEALFVPFARGETGEGHGLGMVITRELVEWHGGWLEVETAPGHGTAATLCLPLGARR